MEDERDDFISEGGGNRENEEKRERKGKRGK